ncbi:MFS transporter [Lentibacillus cibarius]|nr:MFS transporter [Lentibacillus cibarius]
MGKAMQEPIWTKSFIGISMTQFMVFMIYYTFLTTLPIYVIQNLGGSEAQGGLIVTTMLVSAILIRPFSANILDKIGKKRGLIISVALFTVTSFVYVGVGSFIPLLILRFVHGLTFGVATTATGAIAADVIPPARRGAGLGYFAMAMNLAVVAGPFIGLTVLQFGTFSLLFLIMSGLMVIGLICAVVVHVPADLEPAHPFASKKLTLTDLIEPKALPIATISSLVALVYASVISFISVYADAIGLAATASYFFLVFAIVMICTRPFFGRTFDTKGPNYVIIPCLFIFAVGLIVLGFTSTAAMLLLSAGLIGLGYGTLLPSFQTMAIQTTHHSRSGQATATFFMLFDGGIAVGSFVWGLVVAGYGYQTLYTLCGLVVLGITVLFMWYQKRQEKARVLRRLVQDWDIP